MSKNFMLDDIVLGDNVGSKIRYGKVETGTKSFPIKNVNVKEERDISGPGKEIAGGIAGIPLGPLGVISGICAGIAATKPKYIYWVRIKYDNDKVSYSWIRRETLEWFMNNFKID